MEDNKKIDETLFPSEIKTISIANVYCFSSQKKTFCYKIKATETNLTGSLVKVSFGKKILFGIIVSIENVEVIDNCIYNNEKKLNVSKIKNIESVVYENLLSIKFLEFLQKMAWYNVVHIERLMENVILTSWLNKKRQLKEFKQNIICYKNPEIIQLNQEQNQVASKIKDDGFNVNVLYGVMGSGKTYIFLDVVRRILFQHENNQVLIMVPEIALTNNLINIVEDFCGFRPIIWHSSVSVSKKKVYFEGIISGAVRVVISTRSGLLLPYKKLSLIVIDEEHDASYKQDEIPVYNARDMAILRAKYEDIPVILSSATPSIETMINVMQKKYTLHKIKTQFFNIKPPKIEIINLLERSQRIINLTQGVKDKNGDKMTNFISKQAREAILHTLEKGEQSMIFINRRGYSRTLKCCDCGYETKCQNCDNLLSYHKQKSILKCHYCGYTNTNIHKCMHCGSKNIQPSRGAGVEQIDKELHTFCDAKTLLFSSDEINKENDVEKISNEIKNGDVDIIVGTQIMTKGHHFPRLTNIIVLDVDGMSLDNDFRSFERMFQMLFQLSGRAGRERENATIWIQTINPENKVLKFIKNHDIKQFYISEIKKRKQYSLPPYFRFITVLVSSEEQNLAFSTANIIEKQLKQILKNSVEILGPTECNIHYLKRNYRYGFLIKSNKGSDVLKKLNLFYSSFQCSKKVQLKIDVDPYSML